MMQYRMDECINRMEEATVRQWDYVCPFPRMSESDWEIYKNFGDNFSEFPTYLSLTKEKIELILRRFDQHEYELVGMYTNNSNNTVFKSYNEICGWCQITTIIFVARRGKSLVEFTMYESFTAFPEPGKESKCEIVYDIKIRQECRSTFRNIRASRPTHPRLHGGLSSCSSRDVCYSFYSKSGDLEQDPYRILTREFFQDIRSPQLYKRDEPVEKMKQINPTLMYQHYIIHDMFGVRIQFDLLKKLNANHLIAERFDHMSLSVCFGNSCYGYFGKGQSSSLNIGDEVDPDPEVIDYLARSLKEEIKAKERANASHSTSI